MLLLASVPATRRPARFALLLAGLVLYGVSDGLLVLAGLGLDPWDVLHQGLSRTVGLQVGTWAIIVGALVLLAWFPLRQRPGLGTVCNVLVIGLVINLTLATVPAPHTVAVRVVVLVGAVALNGVATGAYIGAGLGPGPRDGLSTGIARGLSLRLVRTAIEISVLVLGWLLGGTVGVGTLLYALAIGPITHVTIPAFRLPERPRDTGHDQRSGSRT
ncbi:MAG: YczE/YyaS/YitT family protein [Nocardioidaceae bacterium]